MSYSMMESLKKMPVNKTLFLNIIHYHVSDIIIDFISFFAILSQFIILIGSGTT